MNLKIFNHADDDIKWIKIVSTSSLSFHTIALTFAFMGNDIFVDIYAIVNNTILNINEFMRNYHDSQMVHLPNYELDNDNMSHDSDIKMIHINKNDISRILSFANEDIDIMIYQWINHNVDITNKR